MTDEADPKKEGEAKAYDAIELGFQEARRRAAGRGGGGGSGCACPMPAAALGILRHTRSQLCCRTPAQVLQELAGDTALDRFRTEYEKVGARVSRECSGSSFAPARHQGGHVPASSPQYGCRRLGEQPAACTGQTGSRQLCSSTAVAGAAWSPQCPPASLQLRTHEPTCGAHPHHAAPRRSSARSSARTTTSGAWWRAAASSMARLWRGRPRCRPRCSCRRTTRRAVLDGGGWGLRELVLLASGPAW